MKAITYKEKKEELEKIFRGYHRAQMKLQYLKEKKLLSKYSNGYHTRKKKLLSRQRNTVD